MDLHTHTLTHSHTFPDNSNPLLSFWPSPATRLGVNGTGTGSCASWTLDDFCLFFCAQRRSFDGEPLPFAAADWPFLWPVSLRRRKEMNRTRPSFFLKFGSLVLKKCRCLFFPAFDGEFSISAFSWLGFVTYYCYYRVSFFSYQILPGFTGIYRVLPSYTGFYWVLLSFTGFYWVLRGFTGFYWILSGFTGLYRVLLGFTGFYRVLPSFW